MITRIGIFLALALVLMAPLASAETFIIADIRVEGLQRVSAGTVFAALPVAVGDVAVGGDVGVGGWVGGVCGGGGVGCWAGVGLEGWRGGGSL